MAAGAVTLELSSRRQRPVGSLSVQTRPDGSFDLVVSFTTPGGRRIRLREVCAAFVACVSEHPEEASSVVLEFIPATVEEVAA
jgi:hypothetical protein